LLLVAAFSLITLSACGGRSTSHAEGGVSDTDIGITADMAVDGPTVTDGSPADKGGKLDGPTPQECAAATKVSSATDLIAHLDTLTWEWVGPYSSTLLPVSDDIELSTKLTVEAKDIAVPADCLNRPDCRHQVTFMINSSMARVFCEEEEQVEFLSGCAKLSLDTLTVRFRASLQDTHPSQYNFVPIIEVLPECNAPCSQGQFECEANHTCWGSFGAYCRLCLAADKQDCACLTAQGPKPDDADCEFMVSGDVMCSGKCKDGRCEHTGTPGWAGCP
jgi:hypothetical protein